MLKLKPSARKSKRYIFIKGNKKDVEEAILEYIGILGWAKSEPFFVKTSGDKCILSVNSSELADIRAALGVCSKKIEIIRVSGTLKKLNASI